MANNMNDDNERNMLDYDMYMRQRVEAEDGNPPIRRKHISKLKIILAIYI